MDKVFLGYTRDKVEQKYTVSDVVWVQIISDGKTEGE